MKAPAVAKNTPAPGGSETLAAAKTNVRYCILCFSHVPWYHFQSLVDSLVGWLTKVKTRGCGSAFISFGLRSSVIFNADPDPAAFSMRIRIQL